MFFDEKQMKECIVNSIENLKKEISNEFCDNCDIVYLGDEIELPTGRADLIFCSKMIEVIEKDKLEIPYLNFYIVELKNRDGYCKDISQIARYANGVKYLLDKFFPNEETNVFGVLICTSQSDELQELTMSDFLSDIAVFETEHICKIKRNFYSINDSFIEKIKSTGKFYDYVKKELNS